MPFTNFSFNKIGDTAMRYARGGNEAVLGLVEKIKESGDLARSAGIVLAGAVVLGSGLYVTSYLGGKVVQNLTHASIGYAQQAYLLSTVAMIAIACAAAYGCYKLLNKFEQTKQLSVYQKLTYGVVPVATGLLVGSAIIVGYSRCNYGMAMAALATSNLSLILALAGTATIGAAVVFACASVKGALVYVDQQQREQNPIKL
jgi:chromate transport protein ChrA